MPEDLGRLLVQLAIACWTATILVWVELGLVAALVWLYVMPAVVLAGTLLWPDQAVDAT